MKQLTFVTLFNSRYLTRGLAMYESLLRVLDSFQLFIIAFDDKVYNKLIELNLKNAEIISLCEFEDDELLNIKNTRSAGEYCWTCSSKSIEYVINNYSVDACTYIDADLMFFTNPQCLVDELVEGKSVLITEHRYSDYCNQEKESGKYCVQFLTIKNNSDGLKVLDWWKNRCIEWCYDKVEENRFGDQKYLDYFHSISEKVHDLSNLGGGVAPWNVNQYSFSKLNDEVYLLEKKTQKKEKMVFYHFHSLSFYDKDVVHLANSIYDIPDTAITYIYKEYIKMTEYICQKYKLIDEIQIWKNIQEYRDNDMDGLKHESNYYHYSLFI